MKKLQLKKEVIANLDSNASAMVKGGNNSWDQTSAISTIYPTCSCPQYDDVTVKNEPVFVVNKK